MSERPFAPITETDLHAYVDRQLGATRGFCVERYLAGRPEDAARVRGWRAQNEALHRLFDPVLDEPVRPRLARRPAGAPVRWRSLAAGFAIAVVSASASWVARGELDVEGARLALVDRFGNPAAADPTLSGFARRAAVAHVVYSPERRRPVEVGADQEQQLVGWLSNRLGTPVTAPALGAVGYDLIGGRLLPGESGPVGQLMYRDTTGHRLTLYLTREVPRAAGEPQSAFRFGRDGSVNVFYWVDGPFGYALSGGADRQDLMRVAQEVHRQFGAR
jgi:anti-sigma factor RsiW